MFCYSQNESTHFKHWHLISSQIGSVTLLHLRAPHHKQGRVSGGEHQHGQQHINDSTDALGGEMCVHQPLKSHSEASTDESDGEERALWYQHAPQRHNRPMQWHDLVTLMLALSAFNIRQFLWTGQSRKVFYTDKGFFRDPYVHVVKRISQSCGQGSLLHKCRSHSPKWLYYVAIHWL